MDNQQEFSKWEKSSMGMLAMLETIKIMLLEFSITQCISQLKMFLVLDNQCTTLRIDSVRSKVNSKILMLLEFLLTTTTTLDS